VRSSSLPGQFYYKRILGCRNVISFNSAVKGTTTMDCLSGGFRFCRICLEPEEEKDLFESIYKNNGSVALQLHLIAGVKPVDVDEKLPGLICKPCKREVTKVGRLRQKIIGSHEYFSRETKPMERMFLDFEMKNLIASRKSPVKRMIEKRSVKKILKKHSPATKAVQKRDQLVGSTSILKQLGIKQQQQPLPVLLETFNNSLTEITEDEPEVSTKFLLNVQLVFECEKCKGTFSSYGELLQHSDSHDKRVNSFACMFCDEAFENDEYQNIHMHVQHWEEFEKQVKV